MTEAPDYFKWRCKECRKEPKHAVYTKGKLITLGECTCKGRTLEMVPMTKQKFEARLR